MKKISSILFVLALSLLPERADAAICASVSSCSFNFNATEVGAFGAGPFGNVSLLLNGAAIDVTIDMAGDQATGFHIIDSGAHHAVTFNSTLSGPFTISNFSDAGYAQAVGAPFGNPPFGNFEIGVTSTCGNGSGCGVNLLSFTVSRVGGFTDVAQLIEAAPNQSKGFFAVDAAKAGVTGAVGVTVMPDLQSDPSVPEPSSMILMSLGLAGLGSAALRSKKRS